MEVFTKKIEQSFGYISESEKGWRREVNLVSWNGREARFDIRDWAPDKQKMSKGLTFSKEDFRTLRDLMNKMDLNSNVVGSINPAQVQENEPPRSENVPRETEIVFDSVVPEPAYAMNEES